jgi:hypothetical protein
MEYETKRLVIALIFIGIMVVVLIPFSRKEMHAGELVIGEATILLAFATFLLAMTETEESRQNRQIMLEEGRAQRQVMLDEARRERRRIRLREQLEGLYSPLMSFIDIIDDRTQHRQGELMFLITSLRTKYEYLAEPKLKEVLREYYNTNKSTISNEKWIELANKLGDAIGIDYTFLIEEYDDLTRPIE